jgi:hypothetical protein
MKDCVVLRPSSRVVAHVDPQAAARLAARKAEGAGASVGLIRRIPTVLIVCVAIGGTAATVPPILAALPPAGSVVVESYGVTHRSVVPGEDAAVPAPAGGLLFVSAVLALAWLRRSPMRAGVKASAASRRAAGDPRSSFLPVVQLAGRGGGSRRAPPLFGRRR